MDQSDAYQSVVHDLLSDPEVSEGKMMGMEVVKVGPKMFGGRAESGMTVKVGRERVGELIASGRASEFDPSGRGRPMKDWAKLREPSDDWLALAEEAKAFVREHELK
ncbi:MAG TPA: hypothetical protein VIL82_03075 [Solirubrobacteraceae bacterium]